MQITDQQTTVCQDSRKDYKSQNDHKQAPSRKISTATIFESTKGKSEKLNFEMPRKMVMPPTPVLR